jgi:hypothetical protein
MKIWGFNDKYLLVTNCYGYLSISSKEISSLLQIGVTYNFDLCALRNVVYR